MFRSTIIVRNIFPPTLPSFLKKLPIRSKQVLHFRAVLSEYHV